jgi:hypothetical protein
MTALGKSRLRHKFVMFETAARTGHIGGCNALYFMLRRDARRAGRSGFRHAGGRI